MKMAREAQQMQKENMARMQAAMEEAEYGGYYEESAVDDSDW
jgi:DNA-binding protein YbaB